jgi:hypothetical protein
MLCLVMNRVRKAPWALASVLVMGVALAAAPAPAQLNMARLLDRYGGGDFEAVARIVVEAEASEPGSLMAELLTGGQRWIDRAPTAEGLRARRLIAAAFALEASGAPTYVAASFDGGPTAARTLPRFEKRGVGFAANERRVLLAWSIRQFLDLRSRDQEIRRAVAEGQPATQLDEAERQWFLAAVALLTGGNDLMFLAGQAPPVRSPGPLGRTDPALASILPFVSVLQIARRRFPDELRFKLAEVYCDERRTTIISRANVIAIQTQTPEDGVIPPRLLEKRPDPQAVTIARFKVDTGAIPTALAVIDGVGAGYEALAAEPALRTEALVRLGYHRIRVGDREGAIAAFGQALDAAQDVDLRYLAHFFRGWTLHRLDRREEAERDYEAALRLRPESRQVRALLAAVIADRGDRREAREVLGEFLSRPLPAGDPWFVFHQGEYRYWPVRVVALRAALR